MSFTPTEDQIAAIKYPHDKPAVVTAAAGSGKTTLLVDRIIRLISDEENPLDITSLAIMTFTVNATQSIREKLNKKLQEKIDELSEDTSPEAKAKRNYLSEQIINLRRASISTINSFCLGIIRENFQQFDLPINFNIADDTKITSMKWSAEQLIKRDFYDESSENGFSAEDRDTLFYTFSFEDDSKLFNSVSKTANILSSYGHINEWLDEAADVYSSTEALEKKYIDVYRSFLEKQYSKLKKSLDLMDEFFLEYESNPPTDIKKLESYEEALESLTDIKDFDHNRFDAFESDYLAFKGNPSMDTLDAIFRTVEKTPENTSEKSLKDRLNKSKQRFNKSAELFQNTYKEIAKVTFSKSEEVLSLPQQHKAAKVFSRLVKQYIAYYSEIKRAQGSIDFSDCELFLLEKLRSDKDFRNQIAQRYSCFIVDEFQDSNDVQAEIFSLLGNGHLFYVGDVKQSIYAFRGANPMIMAKLCAEEDGFKPLPLNKNFRSRQQVIDIVNTAFSSLMTYEYGGVDYAKGNQLVYGDLFEPLSDVENQKFNPELYILEAEGSDEEKLISSARFTAALIKQIHDDASFFITKKDKDGKEIKVRPTYSDFIVLTRKNKPIKYYREALATIGIPAVASKTKNFLVSEEISLIFSFLKAIDNPLDDENTLNVLMSPIYLFNAEEVAELRLGVLGYGADELTDAEVEAISKCTRQGSLLRALKFCTQETGKRYNSGDDDNLKNAEKIEKDLASRKINRKISAKAKAYLNDLETFRNYISNNSVDSLIGKIFEDTDIFAVMSAYDDSAQRISNLRRFESIAADFVCAEYGMLSDFIRFIDRSIEEDTDIDGASTPESMDNSVKIMSFHASKGLEAPICILAEMNYQIDKNDIKGSFLINPDNFYSMDYVDRVNRYRFRTFSGNAIYLENDKRPIGEELRLLYVAMTRAKEKLIMIDCWKGKDLADSKKLDFDFNFAFEGAKPFHWILGALNPYLDVDEGKDGKKTVYSFSYSGLPMNISVIDNDNINKIIAKSTEIKSASPTPDAAAATDVSDESVELSKLISKQYSNLSETQRQEKYSVTELAHKSSNTFFTLTKPAFASTGKIRGSDVGNAYHNFMEHVSLDVIRSSSESKLYENILRELDRVCSEELITETEKSCIDPNKIYCFFKGSLGQRMLKSPCVMREFPMYAEIDVSKIDPDIEGFAGVQGRIDAFFIENDEIVVIDYKTDVKLEKEEEAYKKQVKIYATVLPMLLGKKVSETYLYSFSKGKEHLV